MEEIILGDLKPKDLTKVKLHLLANHPAFTREMVLGISVRYTKLNALTTSRIKEIIREDALQTAFDHDLLIAQHFYSMARKLSFQLFEVDPRIGMEMPTGNGPKGFYFPQSPLFDPSYVTPDFQSILDPDTGSPVGPVIHKCIFCGLHHRPYGGPREVSLWGGGNINFVHASCGPWITPHAVELS